MSGVGLVAEDPLSPGRAGFLGFVAGPPGVLEELESAALERESLPGAAAGYDQASLGCRHPIEVVRPVCLGLDDLLVRLAEFTVGAAAEDPQARAPGEGHEGQRR